MKKYIIPLIFLLTVGIAKSQTATPLAQYTGNQFIYNPGFAGIYDLYSVNLSIKKLWIGIPNSPSLISFNFHAPFQNQRNAFGFIYQREVWGPQAVHTTNVGYAHKIPFGPASFLSLGIQGGILHAATDWDMVKFVKDPGDPGLGEDRTKTTEFDANFGAYFQAESFYLGLSTRHLTAPRIDRVKMEETGTSLHSRTRPQFFFIAGYNFEISDQLDIRPHMLMRYQHNMPLTVSVGTNFVWDYRFFAGVGFMTGQSAVSLSFAAEVIEGLRVGYSYDMLFGVLRPFQRGSHEISINFFVPFWNSEANDARLRLRWH